jgi:GT2 family glycosyltransferase
MLMDGEVVRSFWPTIFDPWLFLTTDESELSLRCKEKGWQTLYVARALALHKGGRSTARVPAAAASYSARNWSYLSLRYVQPRWMRALVVARILTTAILKVAQGRAAVSLALLRGIAAAMRRASIAR